MTSRIRDVIALLVTPFHDDFSLNESALRDEVDWCFEHGAAGVVATPSIGEFVHLSDAERVRCFEITLEQASRHADSVVLAMTSGPDTLAAIRFTTLARDMGFDAGLVIPPFYWTCGSEEACVAIDRALASGDTARAQEIQIRVNNCFPRGGEGALGHIGTTKLTASVATGIDMGPARPPYRAPDTARALIAARLPLLQEVIHA